MSDLQSYSNDFGEHHSGDALPSCTTTTNNIQDTTNNTTTTTNNTTTEQASSPTSSMSDATINTRIRNILERNTNTNINMSFPPNSSHRSQSNSSEDISISTTSLSTTRSWQFSNVQAVRGTHSNSVSSTSASYQSTLMSDSVREATYATIAQELGAHSSFRQLVFRDNVPTFIIRRSDADALSTATTSPSTYSDTSYDTPPRDLPQSFFFANLPVNIRSAWQRPTYPGDDIWSVSSMESDTAPLLLLHRLYH